MKYSKITTAPWNVRKITPESVKELAQSIAEQGLISPITLWKDENGEWLCIAGNRRLAALKSLNRTDIELPKDHYIEFAGTEAEARQLTIAENLQREGLGVIEEAEAVCALLDLGAKPETVAATIGKSLAWVNRRRKLSGLSDEWKERAAEVDADALEHIAAYPIEVQERVAKVGQWAHHWRDLASSFERESRDLDAAKFDTNPCRECMKRTGVEADLFGVCTGKLGACQDCKCFDKKFKEWQTAEIRKIVGDAEMVKVDYSWQMPSDDDTSDKRSKKHPCAYVNIYGDEINVRWGESAKAKKERMAAEEKMREEEREAARAEREREDAITAKLEEWKDDAYNGEYPKGLAGVIGKCIDKSVCGDRMDYCVDAIANEITSWHDADDWAAVIRAFPEIAELAGVTEEERDYLVGKYAKEEE